MKEGFLISILSIWWVRLAATQGTFDSVVNNAIQVALRGEAGGVPQQAVFGLPSGSSPSQAVGSIPVSRTSGGGIAPRSTSGTGSDASRALYRFSQSNAPATNALLGDRSRRASLASRMIAENPEVGGATGDGFQRAVADPEIAASFERAFAPYCYEIPVCDVTDPFRRTDGQCNNLLNPLLGSSFTPQRRVLPAAYDNLVDSPRTRSVTGDMLPSARTVSNNIFQYTSGGMTPVSALYSTYLTHHGQFLDHDLIATPSETFGPNNEGIGDCCFPVGNQVKPEACFNINVPQPDPHFPPGQTCMNFVRHTGAPPLGCQNGVRQQINERTSFVDGSMIYGSDVTREIALRSGLWGRLAETSSENLLPSHPHGCPAEVITVRKCFVAGDHRPSETPTLTVLHTTWLRRHNRIADALRFHTGITNDDILFQNAKRILIAELQHVTYNEFLPAVLDNFHMNVFNLRSNPVGHAEVYNQYLDPRTINAFGVAAYRMGHSLVRNSVGRDRGFGFIQKFPISEHFERPDLMYDGGYESMARWMSRDPKSESDRFLVDGLRNRLFESPPVPGMHSSETFSFDLGALNIQRGRDHGIPSYNAYRELCGMRRAYFFAAFPGGLINHCPEAVNALQHTYRHPDDIDLFAGGMSETPFPGSILGPTFQCIIAYQFSLYKHGDRFWYERTFPENQVAAFTPDQLAQIKQITYSKILCSVVKDIGPGITHSFQPSLMLRPNIPGNSPVSCNLLLQGNPLGFDITPFAKMIGLEGRRSRPLFPWFFNYPMPLNPGMLGITPFSQSLLQIGGRRQPMSRFPY